jgi:hypothetical protein
MDRRSLDGFAAGVLGMLIAAAAATSSSAHSGGLNAEGCHNNHKTGEYHCHRGGGAAQAPLSAPLNMFSGDQSSFANCTAARAAGSAPVRNGDPGYGPHLDRDNDGIGCE